MVERVGLQDLEGTIDSVAHGENSEIIESGNYARMPNGYLGPEYDSSWRPYGKDGNA